jgi:hypothetical protein
VIRRKSVRRSARAKPVRRLLSLFGGLVPLLLLGGCSNGGNGHLAGPPARILMVKDYILRAMLAQDQKLASTFHGRTTYVIDSRLRRPNLPSVGNAVGTAAYTSFAAFARDVAAGRFPRADRAVLYDIEKWSATPLAEQRNPRRYMTKFSSLARSRGLFPILAPARDLLLVPGARCTKQTGENLNQAYLRCDLASADSRAGAFVVQSQVNESQAAVFRAFLASATRQARSRNSQVVVLAQLSTAPLGQTVPLHRILAAARAVGGIVQGFSLNIRMTDIVAADQLLWSFGHPA